MSSRCRIRPTPQCLLSFMPKFDPTSHLQKEMSQVSGGATGWRGLISILLWVGGIHHLSRIAPVSGGSWGGSERWVCLLICLQFRVEEGCVLLTKSCQCPPAGGFPWASGRSFLGVLLSACRIAAARSCTPGKHCPPVFYLLAPAKGSTKQFTRLNKYLDLLWRANIA